MKSVERVRAALIESGVGDVIIELPASQSARTAQMAADALSRRLDLPVPVGAIVKSLVFLADRRPILALVAGDRRGDTHKLRLALGVSNVGIADAEAVRAATGFAIGGVPPVGHANDLPVLIDIGDRYLLVTLLDRVYRRHVSRKQLQVVVAVPPLSAADPHGLIPIDVEVQMDIGRAPPGFPDVSDDLPAPDVLALINVEPGQVDIAGENAGPQAMVLDRHIVAAGALEVLPSFNDTTIGDCEDRRAFG